jgi:hypothetical protein
MSKCNFRCLGSMALGLDVAVVEFPQADPSETRVC